MDNRRGQDDALAMINAAFEVSRPAHFVRDPKHCEECAGHEETLTRLWPETISLVDVGNANWDPLSFATDEAFRYFIPGLARIALGTGRDYYFGQFVSHLLAPGRIDSFNRTQKDAIKAFLDLAYCTLGAEIDALRDDVTLGQVYDLFASEQKQSEPERRSSS
jgi:hypothetical protein